MSTTLLAPSAPRNTLDRIRDLLSLRAFQADPLDMTVSLAERFAGGSLLALMIYPDAVRWAEIGLGRTRSMRELGSSSRVTGSPDELTALLREAGKAAGRSGHVVVGYNYGFSVLKTTSVRRNSHLWSQIKTRPETVLGSDYEGGHAYSLVLHPALESGVAFSYNLGFITQVEKSLEQAGLRCIRLQNTVGSLFAAAVGASEGGATDPLLVISGNSVVFLDVGPAPDFEWLALRSRCDNATADRTAERRPLAYLNQVLPNRGRVRVVFDWPAPSADWSARLFELRPEIEFVPASTEAHPALAALTAG